MPASVIKRYGGKGASNGKLAKWVISLMPQHTRYVEPYFGSGAVLFYKDPEGVSEVANDVDQSLQCFWIVLRNPNLFEQMVRRLEATPVSKPLFEESLAKLQSKERLSILERACAVFIVIRQSRQALGKAFVTSTSRTRRGMNEHVSAWLTAIEGLPDAHERMKRVILLSEDAIDVIKREDHTKTVHYLDPPYLQETRTAKNCYDFEMTAEQHQELLDTCTQLKGKFLLSGYRSKMYDEHAAKHGWYRSEMKNVNSASGAKKKKADEKTECVWTNYRPNENAIAC